MRSSLWRSILRQRLPEHIIESATVIASNIDPNRKCERCGRSANGVEMHHWAPFQVFEDFHSWPTSWLCPNCHLEWHRKMNGYRFERANEL
jgi:hypothetical protein